MLQPRIVYPLRRSLFTSLNICLRCQHRGLAPLTHQFSPRNLSYTRSLRAFNEAKDEEQEGPYIPRHLGRPIGFREPPRPGENIGDRQKKEYKGTMVEKNLEKRKDLAQEWGRNYFRDAINIRKHRGGKTFMANPQIYKKSAALYFPNFHGQTLKENEADTTTALKGKVSVVRVYGSAWGERQADSFTGKSANEGLCEAVEGNKEVVQVVDINIEENSAKRWIIALFYWRLRRQRKKEDWGRYFIVRKGVSDLIRETIGLLNARVGYIYLVDQDCKIRWAGAGDAEGMEKEHLTKGLKRLIEEAKGKAKVPRQPNVEELDVHAVRAGAS
ncbi:hypothetical protein CC78DRAFT_106750 [Lojkania enalia]|uniref:Mitochondrial ATPase complex subunit ATP10 n=1 Tax=Lojkania enalia TaxID=147567 RepID=A0A9P4N8V4_9PLEO|nr:hypothetical protein CC78DRAFT_106750 [Didymosphaeria enalia]